MENINKPSKEDIIEYYVNQNHDAKESSAYFKMSRSTFVKLCHKLNIKKINKIRPILPTEEEIRQLYIVENKTAAEAAEQFNIGLTTFVRLVKQYKLYKPKEQIKKSGRAKPTLPSYEEFYQYYVIEGHTQQECHEHFSVCVEIIGKLVKEWGLLEEAAQKRKEKLKKEWTPPLSKEKIIEVYMSTTTGGKEAAAQLGVSFSTFRRCLAYYNLHKDLSLVQINIKKTWEQKYPEGHPLRNKEVQEKIKKTCLKKYGVKNPSQSQEIINKIKEKIAKEVPISYKELYNYYIIENHSRKECAEYFGVASYIVEDWIYKYKIKKDPKMVKAKIEQTNLEKYGYKNPIQNEKIMIKARNTCLKKYGTTNPAQSHIKHYEFWDTDEHFTEYLKGLLEKPRILDLAEFFNINFTAAINRVHKLKLESYTKYKDPRSSYEDEIIKILKENFNITNVKLNCRDLLPSGKEIDIYLPDYKVGIEFNGEYWHCDLHEKFQDHSGRSHYHQDKSLEAEEQGIFLFHIFEHEWDEMWTTKNSKFQNSHENIINRLGNILTQTKNHIPARKCEIREITKEQKKDFLNKNHIQGNEHTGSYALGLFYEDQLVSCMCFGHSKFFRYNYELTRFATIHDTVVQGGASKLFKYFIDNKMKAGEKVVSYNDITKTKGDIYKILGFECASINEPNYWWVNFDTMDIRSRYQEQEAGEVERMHSQGYHRICDCGTRTWVYTKK